MSPVSRGRVAALGRGWPRSAASHDAQRVEGGSARALRIGTPSLVAPASDPHACARTWSVTGAAGSRRDPLAWPWLMTRMYSSS